MKKQICHYAVIQFMPYPETGEFANVGVVAVIPQKNSFVFKLELTNYSRLTKFFRHSEHGIASHAVKHLNDELHYLAAAVKNQEVRALQAFDMIVRPLETMLRFSNKRVKLTERPQSIATELFNRFVLQGFVEEDNHEQGLQSRLGHLVHKLNLRHPFKKETVGKLYPVNMPLVQHAEEGQVRAIQPLYFDFNEPKKIIEHGNLWIGKFGTLQGFKELPDDILIPVEKPTHEGDVQTAWKAVHNRLKDFGDIIDAGNDKQVERFAKIKRDVAYKHFPDTGPILPQ